MNKTSDEWDDLCTPKQNQMLDAGFEKSLTKDQSVERVAPTVAEKKVQLNLVKQNFAQQKDNLYDLTDQFDVSKQESAVQQSFTEE